MTKDIILRKLAKLREANSPRTLDLFAGCGGLSLGFSSAGFAISGALEIDKEAVSTHALNFPLHSLGAETKDITQTTPSEMFCAPPEEVGERIDVLIGGPPCQAFARVGRAKLREVADHPEAFLADPRSNLYLHYLRFVKELLPLALLVENVPDVLNFGGHNIPEEMCEVLEEMGYCCAYTLLNSVHFGVPQMRERMFLVAYRKELEISPSFPSPTHQHILPQGYEGTRRVALKPLLEGNWGNMFEKRGEPHFCSPNAPTFGLSKAVTAQAALQDLPEIRDHLEGRLKRGARKFDTLIPYPSDAPVSEYGYLMRNWPGFENHRGISDHVIRSLPRDYAIFRRMKPGDQYPEAYRCAWELFNERLLSVEKEKHAPVMPGSPEYEILWKKTIPPYDPGKFPNKWRKMEADQPARTLMAHLGKDSYSHIHYDSSQARTISVREAARLQSFPDGFRFCGAMNSAFRQIGNAVPPLLAKALAEEMLKRLKGR